MCTSGGKKKETAKIVTKFGDKHRPFYFVAFVAELSTGPDKALIRGLGVKNDPNQPFANCLKNCKLIRQGVAGHPAPFPTIQYPGYKLTCHRREG